MDDLESTFQWISSLRKKYSSNSDIWFLRRDWQHIKEALLTQLNDGSYQFSPLDRYEFHDATLSLWSSQDMLALKLITSAFEQRMTEHIPKSCYHARGLRGLKRPLHTLMILYKNINTLYAVILKVTTIPYVLMSSWRLSNLMSHILFF